MATLKLLAMSDMHGQLPEPARVATPADVAVIAGDITPKSQMYYGGTASGRYTQMRWILNEFLPWLTLLPVRHVVLTWGNHDHVGEHPDLLPDSVWPARVHVLVNRSVTIDGVSFHGVPHTPRFHNWAFNDDDTPGALGRRWAQVPVGTDVLVSHGPPFGVCDTARRGDSDPLGSRTQAAWLQSADPNRPRVVICGHIHGSGGQSATCGDSHVYNVALVDESYRPCRNPRVIRLPRGRV